ncbi:MAG: DUF6088 family protein [Bacteroidales bacterium]|nr:DUF6088 family protein [Bacteroidales bacterium]
MIKENSVQNNIKKLLSESKVGTLFNYNDFRDCGTYTAIRSAVVYLCKNKKLERICQGVYVKPGRKGENYFPDNITLAKEIDRKNGATASPKGETQDYLNGKIDKLPKSLEFYSTGSGRKIQLPDGTIVKYTFLRLDL